MHQQGHTASITPLITLANILLRKFKYNIIIGHDRKLVRMLGRALPSISSLANAVLRTKEGAEITASTLWKFQPVAVLVLRRPGCGR